MNFCFVWEVTIRPAADLLSWQGHITAISYKNLQVIIAHYLSQRVDELFDGGVEFDERYFGRIGKGKKGKVQMKKRMSLGF